MKKIPKTKAFDSTLGLVKDGTHFTLNRCNSLESDIFQTRLLLKKVICMRGEEAAEAFYDNDLISRKNIAPGLVKKTLFGEGGVQGLDGKAHYHRKEMFMSLMTRQGIEKLMKIQLKYWDRYLEQWEKKKKIVFKDELNKLYMESVCEWCGVPLADNEVKKRTEEEKAMIDAPGSFGIRNWRGRQGRKSAEKWVRNMIEDVRSGKLEIEENTALKKVALHRDLENKLLDPQIAAVELINVIRPTVSIARWMCFIATALKEHPEYVEKVKTDDRYVEFFVQEVRRFYSFFVFVAGRTKREFEWNGYKIPKNRKIILDLYSTNQHLNTWKDPEKFKPERFEKWEENAFNFIPQGGGDHYKNHRCPGEWIAIESLKIGLKIMTRSMEYELPDQNLKANFSRVPIIPKSRIIMKNIKKLHPNLREMHYEYNRE